MHIIDVHVDGLDNCIVTKDCRTLQSRYTVYKMKGAHIEDSGLCSVCYSIHAFRICEKSYFC